MALGLAALTACTRVGALPGVFAGAPLVRYQEPASGGYRVLYSFGQSGKSDDGVRPGGALRDVNGALYGTTQVGGTTNGHCPLGCGTVFRVDRFDRESAIYRFTGGTDGAEPLSGLIFDGTLFGTTSAGGAANACAGGCGTVFKLGVNGKSKAVLYSFRGGNDGAYPAAPLLRVRTMLYGTTEYGGKVTPLCYRGCGTVFGVSEGGSEKILHRFTGGNGGAFPLGGLYAFGGKLYGTTQYGGKSTNFCATGCGTVFEIAPSGIEKTLYEFRYSPSSNDGAYPAAGLVAMNGKLYGTTTGGGKYSGGTVFEVTPSSGVERVLHAFDCCGTMTDGQYPYAPLVTAKGILFGTTRGGGTLLRGTVFEVRASGAESVLHDFGGKPDGATPIGSLTAANGKLYGTTADGGSRSEGSVFALTP